MCSVVCQMVLMWWRGLPCFLVCFDVCRCALWFAGVFCRALLCCWRALTFLQSAVLSDVFRCVLPCSPVFSDLPVCSDIPAICAASAEFSFRRVLLYGWGLLFYCEAEVCVCWGRCWLRYVSAGWRRAHISGVFLECPGIFSAEFSCRPWQRQMLWLTHSLTDWVLLAGDEGWRADLTTPSQTTHSRGEDIPTNTSVECVTTHSTTP